MHNKFFLGILLFLFVLTSCSLSFKDGEISVFEYDNKSEEFTKENTLGLPVSSWFNNSENPIYINGSATGVNAHNWTWARSQEWCRIGDGSLGNPYVIENITIDIGGTGSGIHVVDSESVYFLIRNCTTSNSGTIAEEDAGIKLENTSYGSLINNNCSNNGMSGIRLKNNCNFNIISGNIANDNKNDGIYIWGYCYNNTIIGNTVSNKDTSDQNYGIIISNYSFDNVVTQNNASKNTYIGISIYLGSSENIISNNFIYENEYYGIMISTNCNNNEISGNFALDNDIYGIELYNNCNDNIVKNNTSGNNETSNQNMGIYIIVNCDNNSIFDNIVSDNTQFGIYLFDSCNNNNISNNFVGNIDTSYQDYGIYFDENCNSNTISGNIVEDNTVNGIYLKDDCDNNTITGNIARNTDTTLQNSGILIHSYCDNNTIIDNTLLENSLYGIMIYNSCNDNTISGNIANENSECGIYLLENCSNNLISGNIIKDNSLFGIRLYTECDDNTVIENFVWKNDNGIGIEGTCDNNLIYLNSIGFNYLNNAVEDGINFWYYGELGNYWSNYSGQDVDYDGIGDIAHIIPGTGNRMDYKPLMGNDVRLEEILEDIIYEIGSTGHTLEWVVWTISPYPHSYEIFKDGISVAEGIFSLFTLSTEIELVVDGLFEGIYSYKLEINGNFTVGIPFDYVEVRVNNTAPVFSAPLSDISFEVGSTENSINWGISDPSSRNPTYKVFNEGIEILSDTEFNISEFVTISFDELGIGTFIYLIEVDDGFGRNVKEIFTVSVINTPPVFTSDLNNVSYTEGDSGNNITWEILDPSTNNPTYAVYRDGSKIISEIPYIEGEPVMIMIDGLKEGTYIYLIEVDDGFGAVVTKTLTISVTSLSQTRNSNILGDYSTLIMSVIIGSCIIGAAYLHARMVKIIPSEPKRDRSEREADSMIIKKKTSKKSKNNVGGKRTKTKKKTTKNNLK